MTSRIVLLGASGFSGGLTARALVRRGQRPVLAGRNMDRLSQLAQALGGLQYQFADVTEPDTMSLLVERGDVLISTVGPFHQWGQPALRAAVGAGAHYLDSTGEPPFIQSVFGEWSRPAREVGSALLPAMGYDYVPGNLAAAIALREAGPAASRVEIGYFIGQADRSAFSRGTMASLSSAFLEEGFARQGGIVVPERPGVRERNFQVGDVERTGRSIGGSEHFALAQSFPSLSDVDVFLGWLSSMSKAVNTLSRTASGMAIRTPVKGLTTALISRLARARASPGGPDADTRAALSSVVIAETFDARGTELTRTVLTGVNPYDFTGELLAWAAERLINVGPRGVGPLGPVSAFGLDELVEGARQAGIEQTG